MRRAVVSSASYQTPCWCASQCVCCVSAAKIAQLLILASSVWPILFLTSSLVQPTGIPLPFRRSPRSALLESSCIARSRCLSAWFLVDAPHTSWVFFASVNFRSFIFNSHTVHFFFAQINKRSSAVLSLCCRSSPGDVSGMRNC